MNEDQFKEKVLPLGQRLYAICVKVLGDKEEAKDVLQDVFIKLWNSRGSLSNIDNLQAYATIVSRNLCLDRIRLRKENVDIENFKHQVEISLNNNESSYDDRIVLINGALTQLNDTLKRVFIMRDIEQMEYKDISLEMGINEENLRVSLSRARRKIREIIEKKMLKRELIRS